MHVQQMIASHPSVRGRTNDLLIRCIEACYDCAQSCVACADASLGEDMVKDLIRVIRLDLDCSDICVATGQIASRRTGADPGLIRRVIETCVEACRVCAEECERYADRYEHCRMCAESCRACEQACKDAVDSVAATLQ